MVPLGGLGHRLQQGRPSLALLGDGDGVVVDGEPGAGGKALDGVGEVEVLDLLHEADGVASGPAAEAVIQSLLAVDRERRRLLGVERAQPHPPPAHPLEGDVLGRDRDEVGRLAHPGDVVGDDAHGVILAALACGRAENRPAEGKGGGGGVRPCCRR